MKTAFTVALLGNPNSGKSSIFNWLTGLRQKVGNFPGVTVEKKTGSWLTADQHTVVLVDLPGLYSLYPTSKDGKVVVELLTKTETSAERPDLLVYIADAGNLERHLLLCTQVQELGFPIVIGLNLLDAAADQGIQLDVAALAERLQVPIVALNGRTGEGVEELRRTIAQSLLQPAPTMQLRYYQPTPATTALVEALATHFPESSPYQRILWAQHYTWLPFLTASQRDVLAQAMQQAHYKALQEQVHEINQRYQAIAPHLRATVKQTRSNAAALTLSDRLDAWLTHPVIGVCLFFVILLLIFQAVFSWAAYPMDWIEMGFGYLQNWVESTLPAHWLTDLLSKGILAGLGGVVVFVPQIAILFFFIHLLEEMGYMARVVYMFDNIMQRVGMNGRSIVALLSGGACAIPAIMSTRTINNWKERLVTMMVTPLISCSARIPVYTTLIAFVAPPTRAFGIISYQALTFMGLYLLSVVAALAAAFVFKRIIPTTEPSVLMIELPQYHPPILRNVFYTVYEKVSSFIREAGKIIIIISVILWAMASYGPGTAMQRAEAAARQTATAQALDDNAAQDLIAARQLEASYAGYLGKTIEPLIAPLGFDWKIGIALITSFAAREVFVGTMATIYSIGSHADSEATLQEKMRKETNALTGKPTYNVAASASLLLFYVFAMQCMSTIAVMRKETGTWKWAIIQFLYMGALAYGSSWIAYQLLR